MVVWSLIGTADQAITRTVTVLVIACPHALGLAIPLVISISTSVSARAGILVKDRLALERMRSIDAVLFDKTGTLTKGQHAVTAVLADGRDESEILSLAAAVESDSEHPLARAIVSAASNPTTSPRVPKPVTKTRWARRRRIRTQPPGRAPRPAAADAHARAGPAAPERG